MVRQLASAWIMGRLERTVVVKGDGMDKHIYIVNGGDSYVECMCTLQKQVSYFNHRVVTMVADKLKRQWL